MSNGNSTLPAANSLVVGITGHRKLRKSELPALRAQVKAFLQDLQARYPELPLVLLSSLAEGSDQLAAEVALDLGLRVIAPLPIPVELYRDDFDAQSREVLDRQVQRVEVVTLPLRHGKHVDDVSVPGAARDAQYAQAGIFVSSHCHILLALWDGKPSSQLGGTAQVVHFHLHGEMPGQIERRHIAATLLGLDEETLVYHLPTNREGDADIADTGPRWLTANEGVRRSVEMPSLFDAMFRRHGGYNLDTDKYAKEIAAQGETLDDPVPCPIQRVFAAADWLARTYQRRVSRVLRITYVLVALMGLAFFTYSHVAAHDTVIYMFLLLFLIGVGVVLLENRREWQRKYLDYRALAEGLRVQSYWRRAGIVNLATPIFAHDNFLQKQDVELGWIRNVMRGASLDGMLVPVPDTAEQVDAVIDQWIGAQGSDGQLQYYARTSLRKERLHHRAELLGLWCVGLGVAISVVLAIFARQFDAHLKHNLVSAMGILSILAAVHEAYEYKKADKELIKQYRFMQRIFGAAQRRLATTSDVQDKRRILHALGEAALTEHAEWTLMHRERPLQHSRI
jgi:hypothetical protein